MNENTKKILMVIGAIVGIYLFIVYVLPFILNVLGIVIAFTVKLLIWVAIIVGIFVILSFVVKNLKK